MGIGGGYVALLDDEAGRAIYRRGLDLGVNYFDGRYGNSSLMLRPLIRGRRAQLILGTKTAEQTAAGAMARIEEDLRELDSDYLDIFYLRTYTQEMLAGHFAPGGSVEGALKAKAQGKIRALGLAGHSDLTALAQGIETGLVDVCMLPLNIVRREALEQVIPAAQRHDVGITIMKPMSVGMAPAHLALPWLATQPIHTLVPGVSNIAQLELDAAVLNRSPLALTAQEEAEAENWRQRLDNAACRICDRVCQPVCEAQIPIDVYLYHDTFYNQYRALGLDGFMAAPAAPWVRAGAEDHFTRAVHSIRGCTHCGKCDQVCPHGLPVESMLAKAAADYEILLEAVKEAGWKTQYDGA
ncbi:MAG: 4Fe-4S ferredoxin-type protein, partial [Chloroflexota bacterium]|nr:4Fe-4S ferredoxin-type protein [Chloroflexota bacterium]